MKKLKLIAFWSNESESVDHAEVKLTKEDAKKLLLLLDKMTELVALKLDIEVIKASWGNVTFYEDEKGKKIADAYYEWPDVEVHDGFLKFRKLSNYSDDHMSTDEVQRDVIEKIANGK